MPETNLAHVYKELKWKNHTSNCAVKSSLLRSRQRLARKQELAKAVAEVRRLIKEYELTASDCEFPVGKSVSRAKQNKLEVARKAKEAATTSRKPVPVKYRHPENAALTWTGRGKAPRWLAEEEAKGKTREVFLV